MGALSAKHGETLVRLARYSLESSLNPSKGGCGGCENCSCGAGKPFFLVDEAQEKLLSQKSAAYVTVRRYPSLERMAEKGRDLPEGTLAEAVAGSAIEVAEFLVNDGGIVPKETVFEVTVLSAPSKLRAKKGSDCQSMLKQGKDGVLVKYGKSSALVLPTLSAERNYTGKEMLMAACEKAGLPEGMWSSPTLEVYRITAQVFAEKAPEGKVFEKKVIA